MRYIHRKQKNNEMISSGLIRMVVMVLLCLALFGIGLYGLKGCGDEECGTSGGVCGIGSFCCCPGVEPENCYCIPNNMACPL